MISKTQAVENTYEYRTWEQKALDFIDVVDDKITVESKAGEDNCSVSIPANFPEQSLNMVLQTVNDAGFTDVAVDSTKTTLTIYWGSILLNI